MRTKPINIANSKFTVHFRDDTDESVIYEVLTAQDYKSCADIIKNAQHAIVDIGAHIGTFELYARSLNSTTPIYAYEPLLENFEVLKTNIKSNRLPAIFPSQQAVSGEVGQFSLHLSENNHNNSLQTPYDAKTGTSVTIQTTTLERIFHKYRITHCDLLKIDCEGAEYDIFEKAPVEVLAKIQAIFMEYHEHTGRKHQELVKILESHGFRLKMKQVSKYSSQLGIMFLSR